MSPARSSRHCVDFGRLYAEHRSGVYAVALTVLRDHQLAEDVSQDIFVALWRRPDLYDAARGELRPFLLLIARNRALDVRRTSRARARLEDRLVDRAATGTNVAPDAATRAARREQWSALTDAIGRLPAEQAEAVTLMHIAGHSASDVAAAHRVPLGTAKGRVRLGLEKLRATLELA